MAIGIGGMLAAIDLAERGARMGSKIPCPLCNELLDGSNGAGHFCYTNKEMHVRHLNSDAVVTAAWELQQKGEIVFLSDIGLTKAERKKNWDPFLQKSAIIAVATDSDKDVWIMATIRGGGGTTNFRVSCRTNTFKPLPSSTLSWEIASWWK